MFEQANELFIALLRPSSLKWPISYQNVFDAFVSAVLPRMYNRWNKIKCLQYPFLRSIIVKWAKHTKINVCRVSFRF